MKRVHTTPPSSGFDPGASYCMPTKRICRERGLTPRNVSPEKASDKIEDEVAETYAEKVERDMSDTENAGNQRFINIRALHNCTDKLACGECASQVMCDAEDDVMKQFRHFVHSIPEGDNRKSTIAFIDRFVYSSPTD